ncbi:hypothetical protein [Natronocalculus amylovorans]|uniref:Uncharacterized protein n=1 Tax=Natronocalculus amylovorans TaxID=2917812 RepID=A0AAE3FYW1_9EURY|nr:hypothetical protein [Natronocalculus amylovorans]MCL9818087.1 hypothetical protein [Natronocalculus amylovorans]NUE03918.1 hypothetical protein [Halorubraceae archaeon YAN]
MSGSQKTDWELLSADPDPIKDLGYQSDNWDIIRTEQRGMAHLVFLPSAEEEIEQEAFIITDENAVCDVHDMR